MTATVMRLPRLRRGAALATILLVALISAASGAASAHASTDVTLYPGVTAPGGELRVEWWGIPHPTSTDWIGLYKEGAGDTDFVAWLYTDGTTSGHTTLTVPRSVTAGAYDVRVYAANGYTRLGSHPLQVLAPSNGVLLGMSYSYGDGFVSSGETVTIGWSGILAPSIKDWVGIFKSGAADTDYITYFYTDGSSTGRAEYKLPPLPAGYYELRLFSADSYTRMAANPFASSG